MKTYTFIAPLDTIDRLATVSDSTMLHLYTEAHWNSMSFSSLPHARIRVTVEPMNPKSKVERLRGSLFAAVRAFKDSYKRLKLDGVLRPRWLAFFRRNGYTG